MQNLVAYIIVAIALVYAGWLFMPQSARRWLISRMASVLPSSQHARFTRLQSIAEGHEGCSTCKGCATDAPADATVKTIRLHRR